MKKKEKSKEAGDQLHAIWSVRYLGVETGHWWSVLWWKVLFCSEQCSASITTRNGFLWDGEGRKRFLSSTFQTFKSQVDNFTVPIITIFTKFDDLMTQIYGINLDDDVNRRNAKEQVEKKFRKPLYEYSFPLCADVCFEGKCWLISC